MFSIEEYEIFEIVNIVALLMGVIFGAVAQKTQFCFSGSIKDYILISSNKRGVSVVMAMITAIVATYIVTLFYDIDLSETVWLRDNVNYFTIILGGCLFGSGMMIADIMSKFNTKYSFGCTSNIKTNRLKNSMIGGAFMGVGGVMAVGCTVGEGLTGFSTLALASLVAILSIFVSGYITAIYLNRKKQLPMCFIFEWED